MRILITGGLGFIGSALVRHLIDDTDHSVLNVDKVTYAATQGSVEAVATDARYRFVRADIADRESMQAIFSEFQPDAVAHLAAESHVDRSIDGPDDFIQTNIVGTMSLLETTRGYLANRPAGRPDFRLLHVSTDEVFGSLAMDAAPFSEASAYDPHSPYAASKAAADHLVRAWHDTYGLPTVITNCSNNYGPYHFPEKLIPLVTLKAMQREPIPVYGDGSNVRDWLHVQDHAHALRLVLEGGVVGETYLVGGRAERSNLEVVELICGLVDDRLGVLGPERRELIEFVRDRPGHDLRYSISPAKIEAELGWSRSLDFETGLSATVDWYLANEAWWGPILGGTYQGSRLG